MSVVGDGTKNGTSGTQIKIPKQLYIPQDFLMKPPIFTLWEPFWPSQSDAWPFYAILVKQYSGSRWCCDDASLALGGDCLQCVAHTVVGGGGGGGV